LPLETFKNVKQEDGRNERLNGWIDAWKTLLMRVLEGP